MGMILEWKKRAAVVSAAAVVAATGAVWAAPPAAAATCATAPGSTVGTDVTIAGQRHRVPAISDVTVCVSTSTTPIVSVKSGGGTCTLACYSVLVGGTAEAEGMSVSYREDGVLKTVPVSPPPVPGPAPSCLISVGSPDAPYPDCFIAIGPELEQPVDELVNDLYGPYWDVWSETGPVTRAAAPVCNQVPVAEDENYQYWDFCSDPLGWALAVSSWWW